MASEPEIEDLDGVMDVLTHFLTYDVVNTGEAGTIYRAFRNGHHYVVIDARNADSRFAATLSGMSRRLVALRFGSRQEHETRLTLTLQNAATSRLSTIASANGRGGSRNSGAPLQPALRLPPPRPKKGFDS